VIEGTLSIDEFAPYTNFKKTTLGSYLRSDAKFPRLKDGQINYANTETSKILRGNAFREFLKSIGVTSSLSGLGGGRRFSIPNKEQKIQLKEYYNENEQRGRSRWWRHKVSKSSMKHGLYASTSGNLKTLLRHAQGNLNGMIEEFSDPALKTYLKKHPNMLKNATMRFDPQALKLNYLSLDEAFKNSDTIGELRENLKFEIDHNRSMTDYWKKLSKGNRISAVNSLFNDAEFAHNLSIVSKRYNRSVKERVYEAMNKPGNIGRTKELSALETELTNLGHRYYAGDQWRGRKLEFKPGYRDTVLDSWSKQFEAGTGQKWSEQFKKLGLKRWNMAMKEVTLKPDQLKQLGTFLGCPRALGAEGGRIGLQAGGQGLSACISTKLKQPGAIEKIAALPEEVGGALGKLKNTATSFLGMLGRVGTKAAPLAAIAALGAIAEPLVKQFRSDDYSTYLSDPEQQKGMLLSMLEAETPKVDEEILKWNNFH